MSVPRLLVVGELNADIVVRLESAPAFGDREQIVAGTEVVIGSSSAIMACGAATMAVSTSLVSVVGDDLLGRFLLDELSRRGVDVSACRVDAARPTGTSTILTLPGGDRSILTALGTIGQVSAGDVPESLLAEAAHVHVGSYFLQDALRANLEDFYRRCRARGIGTSLDPNDDPKDEWDSGIAGVLSQVDVVFCNEREAAAISGRADPDDAAAWFAQRLPPDGQVVIKQGPRGATVAVCRDGRVVSQCEARPEPLTNRVVDTVGAGDSLAAGYLAARLRGLPVEDQLRIGVRNGTATTLAAGGVAGQLTWEAAR